jgi:DNA-binding transcriptional regulator GbsR (MarR family)
MRKRIPIYQLERLVSKGLGVSEIADELGFSKGAVSKALKRLSVAITKDVALRTAPEIANSKLDAMGQLSKVNDLINRELDYIEEHIETASDKERKSFQDQKLKHVAEIRKQLGLFLKIAETLYNAEEVAKFQQTVLEEIGHAAPEIRDRILQRLNERRVIRSTLSFP